jgi:LmbE family N-acetylglucosaminyl deacetylase
MRRSDWAKVMEAVREAGGEIPDWEEPSPEFIEQMAEEERRITTTVDIGEFLPRKRDALLAHASQIADSWFNKIPPEIAAQVFGREHFVRVTDTSGAPVPEDDLFAGIRAL